MNLFGTLALWFVAIVSFVAYARLRHDNARLRSKAEHAEMEGYEEGYRDGLAALLDEVEN